MAISKKKNEIEQMLSGIKVEKDNIKDQFNYDKGALKAELGWAMINGSKLILRALNAELNQLGASEAKPFVLSIAASLVQIESLVANEAEYNKHLNLLFNYLAEERDDQFLKIILAEMMVIDSESIDTLILNAKLATLANGRRN